MLSAFTIRPITRQDSSSWLKLRCELWPDGAEDHGAEIEEYFQGSLAEPLAVLVAVDADGEMIAIAELAVRRDVPSLEGQDVGYIEGLYVTPKMRFSGVAKALCLASLEWAKERGCTGFASDRAGRFVIHRRF